MILGFKDQFIPYVLDGSKRHTIRAGNRWRAGMRADLFARPRQKDMRLLFRAPVVRVEPIQLSCEQFHTHDSSYWRIAVRVNGCMLDLKETELFLWHDGFRQTNEKSWVQALNFWRKRLPFTGQIIHWDYDNRHMDGPTRPTMIGPGARGIGGGGDWSAAYVE